MELPRITRSLQQTMQFSIHFSTNVSCQHENRSISQSTTKKNEITVWNLNNDTYLEHNCGEWVPGSQKKTILPFCRFFFYVSSKSIQRKKMTRNFTKNAFSVLYHNIIVSQQHILSCSLFLWMCIIIPICFMCAHDEINRCSFPVVTIFSVPSGFSHFRRVRAHFMTDDCNRLSFSLQFDLNLFAAAATIA